MAASALVRRAAALGILLAVLGSLYAMLVYPLVLKGESLIRQKAEAEALLERLSQAVPNLDALKAQRDGLASRLESTEGYLPADSSSGAAAYLQDLLRAATTDAGCQVRTIQIVPPEEMGIAERIALRIALDCDYGGLVDAIAAVEGAGPDVMIGGLDLRTAGTPQAGADWNDESELRVTFEAFAFVLREPAT